MEILHSFLYNIFYKDAKWFYGDLYLKKIFAL